MLNKIIQYSLHNRLLVMIAAVALLIWGSITAHNMEVDVFPDLNAPTVVVMTEAQGMAPEEVERLVTFPVETAVNGATDVRRVRSSSTTGFSVVWVEFEWGTNIYTARQIVSEKLATLGEALPDNVGTPTLGPQSSILGEMMIIGLTADSTSLQDLRTIADWTIRPRLLSTGGVAQVAVIGGDIKEYQILLDPARMKYYNIGLDEVLPVVENMNQNATGGILYEYGNEYIIQGVMATTRVEEIGKAVIKTVDDFPITLADIANVQIGAKTPKLGVASEKGKPAVLVTVTKQPGTNTLELTDKLDASIQELRKTLPEDVEVSTDIFRQSRFINSSIHNIQEALLEGAVFVIVVLFFFLMNFRTTIISLVALPLSMLMAILVMHALGLTINTMSLGGLAIAIGSLVDDAIVVMENIYTKIEQGMSPLEAGFKGSNEIFFAVIATTIALVAVFFPIVFLQGTTGRLFREFSIVITGAVIISSFVALTFTPMISTKLLTRNVTDNWFYRTTEPFFDGMVDYYRRALEGFMKYRWIAPLILIGSGVVIWLLWQAIPSEMAPLEDRSNIRITSTAPEGATFEYMSRYADELSSYIEQEVPEQEKIIEMIGGGNTNRSNLNLWLVDPEERGRTQQLSLIHI